MNAIKPLVLIQQFIICSIICLSSPSFRGVRPPNEQLLVGMVKLKVNMLRCVDHNNHQQFTIGSQYYTNSSRIKSKLLSILLDPYHKAPVHER